MLADSTQRETTISLSLCLVECKWLNGSRSHNDMENDETFKFIELYQKEDSIWNPKNKYHKDKKKVHDAWIRISTAMNTDIEILKKKKESLMATFRYHSKKKKASLTSGSSTDELYKPVWLFYDTLEAFLGHIYECKSILNTEESEPSQDPLSEVEEVEQHDNETSQTASQEVEDQSRSSQDVTTPRKKSTVKRRFINTPEVQEANKHLKNAFDTLNSVLNSKQKKCDGEVDECDLYGKLIAKKLRKFTDNVRAEIMYEIDGVILDKSRQVEATRSPYYSHNFSPLQSPAPIQHSHLHHDLFSVRSQSPQQISRSSSVHSLPASIPIFTSGPSFSLQPARQQILKVSSNYNFNSNPTSFPTILPYQQSQSIQSCTPPIHLSELDNIQIISDEIIEPAGPNTSSKDDV